MCLRFACFISLSPLCCSFSWTVAHLLVYSHVLCYYFVLFVCLFIRSFSVLLSFNCSVFVSVCHLFIYLFIRLFVLSFFCLFVHLLNLCSLSVIFQPFHVVLFLFVCLSVFHFVSSCVFTHSFTYSLLFSSVHLSFINLFVHSVIVFFLHYICLFIIFLSFFQLLFFFQPFFCLIVYSFVVSFSRSGV